MIRSLEGEKLINITASHNIAFYVFLPKCTQREGYISVPHDNNRIPKEGKTAKYSLR